MAPLAVPCHLVLCADAGVFREAAGWPLRCSTLTLPHSSVRTSPLIILYCCSRGSTLRGGKTRRCRRWPALLQRRRQNGSRSSSSHSRWGAAAWWWNPAAPAAIARSPAELPMQQLLLVVRACCKRVPLLPFCRSHHRLAVLGTKLIT